MDKKIVVIGGGTGTYTVLQGLKKFTPNLVACVTMMDSGGSSGRLRDEFGQLPAGDVRQALVALSRDTSAMRELFNYRYSKGEGLEGHSFGNLLLTALAEITGGMDRAIAEASKVLNIKGKVLPVTSDNVQLVAEYEDGSTVTGEGTIDEPKKKGNLRIKSIRLEPSAKAYPKTLEEIEQADLIVIGPGDLYTSLVPNLLVESVAQALSVSKAKKVYIMNLMTKHGQTDGFKASDFVNEIKKYLGQTPDIVLINNKEMPEEIIQRYAQEEEKPVIDDLADEAGYEVIRQDFLADEPIQKKSGDVLKRSLIRHDSEKLAEVLINLV